MTQRCRNYGVFNTGMLRYLFFVLIFFICQGSYSQCNITATRESCINDLVSFSINTSGNPVSNYSWDFSTYGTSGNSTPLVKFTATGKVIITCMVTFTGGQTCSDTHEVQVLPLPTAGASLASESIHCLNGNQICLNDSNKKASRGIKSISLLWGDGTIENKFAPIPKKWCHNYSDTGIFKIDFEIADSSGCKDKYSLNVRIYPSVKAKYTFTETKICDSVKVCFNALSEGGKSITTQWYPVPGNTPYSYGNSWCRMLAPSEFFHLKMVSTNEYGCSDSTDYQIKVGPGSFQIEKLDSLICINELYSGKLTFLSGEEVQWYLNGIADYVDSKYVVFDNARLGMNYIRAGRIGGCKGNYLDSFVVIGVRAVGKIYNENRRKVQDTVFLIDLTKQPPGTIISRLWDFGDDKAPQCTTWTAMGQNVGINCNFSRDSIARHFYSDTDCYAARLIISEQISGCYDDTLIPVYRKNACPKMYMPQKVCLGDFAGFSMPGNMYNKVRNNNFLIVDTVKPSDTIILYGGYGRYKYTTLGFKSPVLWRYYPEDTVWTESGGKIVVKFIRKGDGWVADTFFNEVEVVERSNSEFDIIKISECNPFKARLKFRDSIWRYPGLLTIDWGDTTVNYSGWSDSVTELKPLDHVYKKGGNYRIEVTLFPTKGCHQSTVKMVAFSHIVELNTQIRCWTESICFNDSVIEAETNIQWKKNNGLGNLYWNFGDGKQDSGYGVCHRYAAPGKYAVTLTAVNKSGCSVSTTDTILLSAITAGIEYQPTIFCSDIRQYFDSSRVSIPDGGQKIIQWNWDFGDGSSPVFVKNPAHIFPGGGVYRTRLVITSNIGCKDTAYRDFTVIGPEVSASIISDSAGCAPLTVKFGNNSKNAGNFIWEFGDKNNTLYSTDQDTNTQFTYKDAGVFYVHVIGGDSFYNPTTGSKYYCSVRYPAPGQNQLRIRVFESAQADFNAPLTVCKGDSILLENISSNGEILYFWDMGNGDTFSRKKDTFYYKYSSSGTYTISLLPKLVSGIASPCADTAVKQVQVVELKPDFELDCNKTKGSELFLKNLSGYDIPGYEWTLLLPDSTEKMLSKSTDLLYHFGNDTGNMMICLGVNGGKSCGGKVCKVVLVQGDLFFANVFTPGIQDGINDTYRIPLFGYSEFEIRIFNRWGERVYYSKNPREEWNGRVNNVGYELPAGTYFYQVWYRPECKDEEIVVNGSIQLIR